MADTIGKFKLKGKRVECLVCNNDYFNKRTFNSHFNRVHREIKKPSCYDKPLGGAKCQLCRKIYSTIYQLKIHIKTAHEGQKIKCEICEREFSTKDSLKVHVRTQHSS